MLGCRLGRGLLLVLCMLLCVLEQRPARAVAPPAAKVVLQARLDILTLPLIDDKDGSYQMTARVQIRWTDPRVRPGLFAGAAARQALQGMWHPDLLIDNCRTARTTQAMRVTIETGGGVTYEERFDVKAAATFDLQDLPFDRQRLPFVVACTWPEPCELQLVADPASQVSPACRPVEWRLGALTAEPELDPAEQSQVARRLTWSLAIQRRPAFYLYTVCLPSVLIVLAALSTFWYHGSNLNGIAGVSVSCLLSLITLNTTVASYLPRISHITRLTHFSQTCFALTFLSLLLNTAIHTLEGRYRLERLSRARRVCSLLLGLALLACCAALSALS